MLFRSLEKAIPNELIKEHVSLNIKVIKSISKKSLDLLDRTFERFDDILKEDPEEDNNNSSNNNQTYRSSNRTYYRPGNDEPSEPTNSSATSTPTAKSNPKSNSSSGNSTSSFINQSNNSNYSSSYSRNTTTYTRSGGGQSGAGSVGSANGPRSNTGNQTSVMEPDPQLNVPSSVSGSVNQPGNSIQPIYNYR